MSVSFNRFSGFSVSTRFFFSMWHPLRGYIKQRWQPVFSVPVSRPLPNRDIMHVHIVRLLFKRLNCSLRTKRIFINILPPSFLFQELASDRTVISFNTFQLSAEGVDVFLFCSSRLDRCLNPQHARG